MKKLADLSRIELSLLLYLETVMVDYSGLIQGSRLNRDDHEVARRWKEEGFIQFGRIAAKDIGADRFPKTHWVILSEEAWALAHEARRDRANKQQGMVSVHRNGVDPEARHD